MLITNTDLKWYQYQDDNGFVYRILIREAHQLALATLDPGFALLPSDGTDPPFPRRWKTRKVYFEAVRDDLGPWVLKRRIITSNPHPYHPFVGDLLTLDGMELRCVRTVPEKKPLG